MAKPESPWRASLAKPPAAESFSEACGDVEIVQTPEALINEIERADFADMHNRLVEGLFRLLHGAGYESSPATQDEYQADAAKALIARVQELSQKLPTGDTRDLPAELAVNVLSNLAAVLHTVRSQGSVSRLVHAGFLLGQAVAAFGLDVEGITADAAQTVVRKWRAQEHGKRGAAAKITTANAWKAKARADWKAYTGDRSRSAWAKANAGKYQVSWRTLFEAIPKKDCR